MGTNLLLIWCFTALCNQIALRGLTAFLIRQFTNVNVFICSYKHFSLVYGARTIKSDFCVQEDLAIDRCLNKRTVMVPFIEPENSVGIKNYNRLCHVQMH